MEWEAVIGLEIHAQLATCSKIFSGSATAYGAPANAQASLVDLAYPGVLPVLNAEAVRMAVKFGLAINARVARRSVFARKNYFYPDLPKGYQISQYELPIVSGGAVDILLEDGGSRRIGITRAHLEEDAGKSLHEGLGGVTAVDLNRAGTPLIEIVSEPHMHSAKEAVAYLKKIHTLVRYLGICDGNMQEGSFRCDANVSVRAGGTDKLGTRTETKNLNSFRFVDRAINYEIARQIELLEGGGQVVQETRLYDADRGETRAMRSKEEANDYRYFPDPDLLPVEIDQPYIDAVAATLPELPDQKAQRLMSEYALSAYDAGVLTVSAELADYFEVVVRDVGGHAKLVANTVMGELSGLLNRDGVEIGESRISPARLAGLLRRLLDHTISGKLAKDVVEAMWEEDRDADAIIEARGLRQITDEAAIQSAIDAVLAANPQQLAAYRAGKDKLFGFFIGQVMKATSGKANPAQLNELLKKSSVDDFRASDDGTLRRFVLEHHPVRAFWTRLEGAWRQLRALQCHSPPVEALLGETVTAAVLLAATLKFRGTLSLQLQGRGLVRLLVAQCTHDFQIRAVARINEDAGALAPLAQPSFGELVGRGSLAVTIEAEERSARSARYQGIVALEGQSLANCLEAYFATSEQLPTRIALSADAAQAAGVLLQKMPGSQIQGEALGVPSQEAWQELQQNLTMLPLPALQSDAPEKLLQRICGPHDGRLFSATPVRFVCRCSAGRVASLLRALGAEEIHSILAEEGAVTVTCEFCGRPYRFDAIDAQRLFADGAGPVPPASVN